MNEYECGCKIFDWYWTNTSENSQTIKTCICSEDYDGCYGRETMEQFKGGRSDAYNMP